MNVAYYVLAFDRATDAFYDALGIGWPYLERERKSLFTLAMNVDYVREVMAGTRVRIESRLLDYDPKRIHYFHAMHDAREGWLAATNELVAMHVDMASRRARLSHGRRTASPDAAAHVALHRRWVDRKLGIRQQAVGITTGR
jgi:acyl-CoA thioester hydrolase